jgi:hypothetical protein
VIPETERAVVEAYGKTEAVEVVAVKYPARAFIPRSEFPATEKVLQGEEVAIPTFPAPVMVKRSLVPSAVDDAMVNRPPFVTSIPRVHL